MKPIFVTFEGIEASGKTTTINILKQTLNSDSFFFTREPGGTGLKISEDIRRIILDPKNTNMSYKTEALLYAASRSQHIEEVINPKLKEGINVICDRYIDSSFVYQGECRGLGKKYIKQINEVIMPDITFFFNLTPEQMLKRLKNRTNKKMDRLDKENIEFHKKAYFSYKKLIKEEPKRFYVINPHNPPEKIAKEIKETIDGYARK